jgi:hypothetical protein
MSFQCFRPAWVAVASSLMFSSAAVGQHAHGEPAKAAQTRPSTATAIKPAPAGALPALPQVPFSPARPMPVVQQVYEFVPCFCGCERGGHTGNHDCFVRSRAANGRITEWEPHGIGCQVCIDVGRDAMMLFNSGASLTAIRDAIDKKYRPHYPSSTPTPMPPAPKRKA